MGPPCLFMRQQALKMGYFYCLVVKNSNHLHTEIKSWLLQRQNFILKIKLLLFT